MWAVFVFLIAVSFVGSTPTCPDSNDPPVFLPHETLCTKYYECSNGIAYLMSCPTGLDFNQETNSCDFADRAGCRFF
ncbi:hypothetical protein NQ315_009576 [Exocentrus adspersus]|uniref:Chitin-binding type-2 domain-containing protein n=1 Tax=Exocentrus adspersus TaxID=1586481 RepID=A0AAV8WH96_9CUCU|nr:hypothetical protein NQ315_009576 [Exocentrus adspersus]